MSQLLFKTSVSPENQQRFGIYQIRCIPNGRVYIGQAARQFIRRWKEHQGDLFKKRHNPYMQNSFNKYGIDAFEVEVLEYLPEKLEKLNRLRLKEYDLHESLISNKESQEIFDWLNKKEVFYIKQHREKYGYNSVFNCNDGGGGINPTKEYRENLSKSMKRVYYLADLAKRISSELNIPYNAFPLYKKEIIEWLNTNNICELFSDIFLHAGIKENLSKILKDLYHNSGLIEKISKLRKGKPKSEKHKNSLKKASQKRYSKQEEHDKLSKAMKESRAKGIGRENLSLGQKRRFANPEERRRVSESEKGKIVSQKTRELNRKKAKEQWNDEHYRNYMRKIYYPSYERRALDDILHDIYKFWPKLRYKSIQEKWRIVNEFAEYLKNNTNNV